MPYVMANDGCKLHYELHGESGPPLILIHGWSGSRRYFDLNIEHLAKTCRVYAVDLRFHGESDKPSHGFHVHRLAADLHSIITCLAGTERAKPVVLGSSLGCAVIWAYVELYGNMALGKCVFVDQAPSQWALPDWTLGSKGIYDAASLANIQAALGDMSAFADGNAECCLSIPPSAEVLAVLKAETLKCSPQILGKLMADHAPKDWREVLKRITVPCLNLYGTKSGCFPEAGCAAVGELIPDCRNQPFDGCNHWLYLEAPTLFNEIVAAFVEGFPLEFVEFGK